MSDEKLDPIEDAVSTSVDETIEEMVVDEAQVASSDEIPQVVTESSTLESPVVEPAPKESRKGLYWGLGGVAIVLAIVGILFNMGVFNPGPGPSKPIAEGAIIQLPDNTDGGLDNAEKVKKWGEQQEDKSAPEYVDPSDLSNYRIVNDDGTVTLRVPLDGPCRVRDNGNVLPPANFLHVCYYEDNGAIFYTSHAVIGPRTGALENIRYLQPGNEVLLAGDVYLVESIYTFRDDMLPEFLFKPGVIALVTCHLDSSVKTFDDFTKTDFVKLVRK